MKPLFLFILLLASISTAYATDSDAKMQAAQRYLATSSVSDLLNDVVANMSTQVPEERRAEFVRLMTIELDHQVIERAMLDALIQTFTVGELNAFADFYGSEAGKSAMSKFGLYMSLVMPAIQQETMRAVKKMQAAKQQ